MDDVMMLLPDVRLQFNIQHPSIEESYWYGYECARANFTEEDNPFPLKTTESDYWIEGWWDAFYAQEPMFECPTSFERVAVEANDSANDYDYHEQIEHFFVKLLEISGVLVISAIVGYQLIELVA